MLDSGGFALSKSSAMGWTAQTVGDFIEAVEADIYVSLDLPPHLDDCADRRKAKIATSTENFRTISQRFPAKTVMPVVHGRNTAEIELSLKLLGSVPSLAWIGLGGVVPLLQHRRAKGLRSSPEKFIAQALALIRTTFPKTRIHVFGAGGTRTFPAVFALGADSGDSIGWRQAAGFGSIFLPMKSQRIIRWNAGTKPPRRLMDEDDLEQLSRCGCSACKDLNINERIYLLSKHFQTRSIHNAWTLLHQSEFWPSTGNGLVDAVSNGILGREWAEALRSEY